MQEIPADESASKGQECLVDVGPLFVSDAQAAKLIQPSEGPFYHPSPPAQSTAMRMAAREVLLELLRQGIDCNIHTVQFMSSRRNSKSVRSHYGSRFSPLGCDSHSQ